MLKVESGFIMMAKGLLMEGIARRNDIDLLRVFAFAVLIFYHIGMVYVADWEYHVKSQYRSDFLEYLILMVNQWRLPLLFVISGFATRQMLKKYSVEEFIRQRSFLLLLPLLTGVLIVVPPQLYVEMLSMVILRVVFGYSQRSFMILILWHLNSIRLEFSHILM